MKNKVENSYKFIAVDLENNITSDPFTLSDIAYSYDQGFFLNSRDLDFDIFKENIEILQHVSNNVYIGKGKILSIEERDGRYFITYNE